MYVFLQIFAAMALPTQLGLRAQHQRVEQLQVNALNCQLEPALNVLWEVNSICYIHSIAQDYRSGMPEKLPFTFEKYALAAYQVWR